MQYHSKLLIVFSHLKKVTCLRERTKAITIIASASRKIDRRSWMMRRDE